MDTGRQAGSGFAEYSILAFCGWGTPVGLFALLLRYRTRVQGWVACERVGGGAGVENTGKVTSRKSMCSLPVMLPSYQTADPSSIRILVPLAGNPTPDVKKVGTKSRNNKASQLALTRPSRGQRGE